MTQVTRVAFKADHHRRLCLPGPETATGSTAERRPSCLTTVYSVSQTLNSTGQHDPEEPGNAPTVSSLTQPGGNHSDVENRLSNDRVAFLNGGYRVTSGRSLNGVCHEGPFLKRPRKGMT